MHTYIPSAWPRSTTFVSPATISTPAAEAAAAIASTSARSTSASSPSSRTRERLSATGRAPATARSFTVPFTASSPIEPPGNRSGFTTKLSVVSARPVPSIVTTPASPSASSAGERSAGTSMPSMSAAVALPPAPCAIVMRSSRNFGRLERAVSMIPRTFALACEGVSPCGPRELGMVDVTTRPPARARSGRSCSTRRRRPRWTPCRSRSGAPACTRTRRPCTRRA